MTDAQVRGDRQLRWVLETGGTGPVFELARLLDQGWDGRALRETLKQPGDADIAVVILAEASSVQLVDWVDDLVSAQGYLSPRGRFALLEALLVVEGGVPRDRAMLKLAADDDEITAAGASRDISNWGKERMRLAVGDDSTDTPHAQGLATWTSRPSSRPRDGHWRISSSSLVESRNAPERVLVPLDHLARVAADDGRGVAFGEGVNRW